MPCQLPADCLSDIFEYLYDDKNTLYSCLLVNSLCCEIAVRILWRNIWKFFNDDDPHISLSIITTLFACLPKEAEKILYANGIYITIPIPLFNYASFCKVISFNKINEMIQHTLWIQHSRISESTKDLLSQEILKMLLNQISSLKVLKNLRLRPEDIYLLTEAKIHLSKLVELKCGSDDICSKFISQVCHNLRSLSIKFRTHILTNELIDLISSQNNLKIVNLQHLNNDDYYKIIPSLSKHSLTLTKLTLKNSFMTIPFIAMFKNLQELNLKQRNNICASYQLQNAYFSQLKILKIATCGNRLHDEMLINFLENNGKNLTEFQLNCYYGKSLNLALAKFCPNLKILHTHIKEEETLKLILNNCQYLEIIKFYNCWLISSKIFFKILTNYSQIYFCGLILDFCYKFPIDELYQSLEEFFINWQDRTSQRSLSLIIFISECTDYVTKSKLNMKDIKILIEKYMKLGIIEKFEIKSIPYQFLIKYNILYQ